MRRGFERTTRRPWSADDNRLILEIHRISRLGTSALCASSPMLDVTGILSAAEQGDPHAADRLLQLVYTELRRLAAQQLANETPGQTLDATALVHEAYLRLVPGGPKATGQHWNGRGHFFAAAAEAMRRILVDNARRKACIKHGGQWRRVVMADPAQADEDTRLVALDDALTRLAAEDSQAARVVELHHFAGLSHELVAEALGLTVYQARLRWRYAQAWLRDALG
jgi:RNA polymerase sigma factor (TIGR02999 family)